MYRGHPGPFAQGPFAQSLRQKSQQKYEEARCRHEAMRVKRRSYIGCSWMLGIPPATANLSILQSLPEHQDL